jgi:hypothetical protein
MLSETQIRITGELNGLNCSLVADDIDLPFQITFSEVLMCIQFLNSFVGVTS